jgi:hypothetical protein
VGIQGRSCAAAAVATAAAAAATAVARQTPRASCRLRHLCRLQQRVTRPITSAGWKPSTRLYQQLQCTTMPMYQKAHLRLHDGLHEGPDHLLDDRGHGERPRCGGLRRRGRDGGRRRRLRARRQRSKCAASAGGKEQAQRGAWASL